MTAHWTRPVNGNGSWQPTAPHRPVITDMAVAFVVCLLFFTVVIGLYLALRPVVCHINHDQLRHCPGYVQTTETP